MRRREFLMLPLGVVMCEFLKGCGGSSNGLQSEQPNIAQPDIILTGNESELAEQVRLGYAKLHEMAEGAREYLRIGFYGSRREVLRMHLCEPKGGVANYKHVRLVRESTGEAVRLVWGWDKLKPQIRFVNDDGELLTINGVEMEFWVTDAKGRLPTSSIDWLSLGAKWLAVGFAIWLGAQVAKLVVSAIAFLAFSAMVVGALMMAAGIAKSILELTGWTFDDVKNFLVRAVEELASALLEGAKFIEQVLPGLAA